MLGDDQVQEICREIESRFESLTAEEAAAEKPPDVLHHYTSSEGLLGIIQAHELWATNVLYLNDASELSDAARILQDELESTPLRPEEYADLFF
jgi:hypothetical protein